jgi:DNA-binding CsgD family transcriptional regulator
MSDYIAAVEAAYDVDGTTQEWLQKLATCVAPWLDRGQGVMLWQFDMSDPANLHTGAPVLLGCPTEYAGYIAKAAAAAGAEGIVRSYGTRICDTIFEALHASGNSSLYAAYRAATPPESADFIAIKARSPDQTGVLLGAPLPTVTRIGAAERRAMSQVGIHVAAGYRLRRALDRRMLGETDERVEAVLTPGGRVEHALDAAKPGALRESLCRHARAIDRARSKIRSEPLEALELWKALVAGRWSLVDRFDNDGRRYLVALRNDPQLPDPRALTLRERQVAGLASLGHTNKLISYALGISGAAVSTHLKSAFSKLGVAGRTQLAAPFAPRPAGAD